MKPGPKPKPTAAKLTQGVAKSRINLNEPKFSPVTDADSVPPAYLTKVGAQEWVRVYTELTKTGVLVKLNRNVLAGYCAAYANWREAQGRLDKAFKNSKTEISPMLVRIVNQTLESFRRYSSEFGLTPSSRSGIKGADPENKKDDEMMKFLLS